MRRTATVHVDTDPKHPIHADVMYDYINREYVVQLYDAAGTHQQPADYFTSDKDDALDTAQFMVDRLHAQGGSNVP